MGCKAQARLVVQRGLAQPRTAEACRLSSRFPHPQTACGQMPSLFQFSPARSTVAHRPHQRPRQGRKVTALFCGKSDMARPSANPPLKMPGAGGPPLLGADDGTRTRDPHLGKVMLYQLSHIRAPPARSR